MAMRGSFEGNGTTRRGLFRQATLGTTVASTALATACSPADISLPFSPTAIPPVTIRMQVWDDIQDKDVLSLIHI